MVKAKFAKKSIWNKITLFCGLFLIGFTLYIARQDQDAELFDILLLAGAGTLIAAVRGIFLLLNHNAFLTFADGTIKGKYHWFGKIDCHISDVDFVQGQMNTLILQLKDGTSHKIMEIVNPWDFVYEMEPLLNIQAVESPEELNCLKSARKRAIISCGCLWGLMIASVFITVFLTEGRERAAFTRTDRIVFGIMCAVGLSAMVGMFCYAQKAGKLLVPIESQRYQLRRTVIETAPLLSGNVIKVLAHGGFMVRITIFGRTNDEAVHYSAERLDDDYRLSGGYRSEIFEDMDDLMADLGYIEYPYGWIDITDKFMEKSTAE